MTAYYNEIDEFAAEWLRNLIAAGHLPAGDVDTRSIVEVQPDDLKGYDECHFFAGIGGWPLALRMAGWTGRPVWTGSCPCQPFSAAGKQDAHADERHLWPEFLRLIEAARPVTIFGEQVASALGRAWLAGVRADLDVLGYAFGAADICAAGVSAPHSRQRLWWVAYAGGVESRQGGVAGSEEGEGSERGPRPGMGGTDCWLGNAHSNRSAAGIPEQAPWQEGIAGEPIDAGSSFSAWDSAVWLPCADGKARRIEPGIAPLVDGVPARVGRLRAYGNAIVPQVAAEFVRAYVEAM